MPKVSVIVPIYKVEPYLRRCVDSILNQSYTDFELILVDDGSPDNCGAICDEYAAKDSRVHVIHQENGGLSAARNAGIDWAFANSDSQWLAFIDSDDWIHKDYFQILYNAAQTHNAEIAICRHLRVKAAVDDADYAKDCSFVMTPKQASISYYDTIIAAWSKIYQKSLFQDIRFPVGKLHEDAYITHLLTFRANSIAVFDNHMYYYYYNPQSITGIRWNPKRMDDVEAHELRIKYFEQSGDHEMYKLELQEYAKVLMTFAAHALDAYRGDRSHIVYLREIKRKIRNALKKERSVGRYELNHSRALFISCAYILDFFPSVFHRIINIKPIMQDLIPWLPWKD